MHNHKQLTAKVSDLKNLEKNARKHSPAQIQQITESIRRFGFLQPIVISQENVVQAGNGRLEAARILGLKTVPAIRAEGLTPAELKAYALIDNRLSETSEWDKEMLNLELEDLCLNLDFDMSAFGFSTEEIESLLNSKELKTNDSDSDEKESKLKDEFMIIVTLKNEQAQNKLWEELTKRGFEVKIP
jgi:ParB-like chromosome segregation protein Spo0J